jgi:hypothetical protein
LTLGAGVRREASICRGGARDLESET